MARWIINESFLGSSFLDRYEEQLSSLCRNQRFINMISLASKEAAEKTGSDTGKAGRTSSPTLFRERAYLLLPEYAHIVDDVAQAAIRKSLPFSRSTTLPKF